MTRRSRLSIGFHRVGLILAVPTGACGACFCVTALFSQTPEAPLFVGVALVICAALLYAASWAVGWAVRGFLGEAEPSLPAPVSLGAAAAPQADLATIQAPKRIKPAPPKGFGGWLILPAIGTVLAPFVTAKSALDLIEIVSKAADLSHPVFKMIYGEIAINLVLVAFAAWTLVLMLQKARTYPRMFVAFLAAGAVVAPLDAALAYYLFDISVDTETSKTIGRAVVSAIVWIPYMLVSKRVAATFVN